VVKEKAKFLFYMWSRAKRM